LIPLFSKGEIRSPSLEKRGEGRFYGYIFDYNLVFGARKPLYPLNCNKTIEASQSKRPVPTVLSARPRPTIGGR
jgi:hypothetical protein